MSYASATWKGTRRPTHTAQALSTSDAQATVVLLDGEDAVLPVLADGDWYYAFLRNPCTGYVEHVRVTAMPAADTLTIVRPATTAVCFPVGSILEYDNFSVAAIQAMQTGKIMSVSAPFAFDAATGALTFDVNELQRLLPGMIQQATAPLVYDNQSGTLSLDEGKLMQDVHDQIIGWFSADSPLVYDNGKFTLDISALKNDLGITT